MKKAVFVSGAAGFIGGYVTSVLADSKVNVIGLDKTLLPEFIVKNMGMTAFVCGHCDHEHLEKAVKHGEPTAIIHCAGSGSVADSFQSPLTDFQANVETAVEVLDFARCRGNVPVIMVSSAAVYGATSIWPQHENMNLHPVSPYGVHKVMLENLCHSYARHFSLPIAVVRLFSVYGEGLRKQLLWDACCKAKSGQFSFAGTGEEQRDWIHVTDAARLLVLAIQKASPNCPIINGGTGKGTSISDILTRLGANWSPKLVPHFTGVTRQGDPSHYVADITNLNSWGFKAQTDIDASLVNYIHWFKKEKHNK